VNTVRVGFFVSVLIELVQLALQLLHIWPRSVDIDDVILNVAGACLGYLLWLMQGRGVGRDHRPYAGGVSISN
jgi:glycopeptide antibiotics resistance protein